MQIQYANMMAAVQGPEESDEQLTPSHPKPETKPETKAPTGKSKKLRKE
jgi:hypothetical protein